MYHLRKQECAITHSLSRHHLLYDNQANGLLSFELTRMYSDCRKGNHQKAGSGKLWLHSKLFLRCNSVIPVYLQSNMKLPLKALGLLQAFGESAELGLVSTFCYDSNLYISMSK